MPIPERLRLKSARGWLVLGLFSHSQHLQPFELLRNARGPIDIEKTTKQAETIEKRCVSKVFQAANLLSSWKSHRPTRAWQCQSSATWVASPSAKDKAMGHAVSLRQLLRQLTGLRVEFPHVLQPSTYYKHSRTLAYKAIYAPNKPPCHMPYRYVLKRYILYISLILYISICLPLRAADVARPPIPAWPSATALPRLRSSGQHACSSTPRHAGSRHPPARVGLRNTGDTSKKPLRNYGNPWKIDGHRWKTNGKSMDFCRKWANSRAHAAVSARFRVARRPAAIGTPP